MGMDVDIDLYSWYGNVLRTIDTDKILLNYSYCLFVYN